MKKDDKRRNARVGLDDSKPHIFKLEHMDPIYFDYFLNDLALVEDCTTILNMCSGKSKFGTDRFDIDPKSNATRIGNMFEELKTMSKKSYDMVYVDPLFKFYNPHCTEIAKYYPGEKKGYGNQHEWQYELAKIAKKILVEKGPQQMFSINWPSMIAKKVEYFLVKDSRPFSFNVQVVYLR